MNILKNKNNFINVLVDCKGYGEEEAQETAVEYGNDLEAYIRDCGGDDIAVSEALEYLS